MQIFVSNPLNFILLLLSNLLLFHTKIHADYLTQKCTDTATYTSNSPFDTNLQKLFSSISTNAPPTGFSNASSGNDPDRVYGLAQCRGDVDAEICKSCVDPAIRKIQEVCPNKKSGIIWFRDCLVRYSHEDFLGNVDVSSRTVVWNVNNKSEEENRSNHARVLVDRLVGESSASPMMFAIGYVTLDDGEVRYGLVQCTRDLNPHNCSSCLAHLAKNLEDCCGRRRDWHILAGSCVIGYHAYNMIDTSMPTRKEGDSTPTRQEGKKRSRTRVVITSVAAALGVTLLGCCICCCLWRRKRSQKVVEDGKSGLALSHNLERQMVMDKENEVQTQELPLIDLVTIQAATNNFSDENKLGQGGFGPVYKGMLSDGKEIAVKRLSRSSWQGLEEFKNEITLIAKLQHRNLVRILYCCIERDEKLLVYEYMPNTSLDVFLFNPSKRVQLDWERRQNIVGGIARGLLYLHEDSRLRIIHRDLKASNVLLDNEMNPKISDFGMARIFGGNQSQVNTNRVVGTYGYMAPEYAMVGMFSVKSDVFSFGVLLLEIVSGKRNNSHHLPENALNLLTYAWKLWCEDRVLKLIDPLLSESCPTSEAFRWIHIGLLCVQEDAADRPTMSTVIDMLRSKTMTLPKPTRPGLFLGRTVARYDRSSSDQVFSINEVTISTLEPR